MSLRQHSENGFTLLELTAAITLLGFALVTLLGLQTRLLDSFIHERKHFRAALVAQYLMTFIEIEQDPPEVGVDESNLLDELSRRGYFDGENGDELRKVFDGWKTTLEVVSVDFPGIQADVLRRIDLHVSWGDSDRDRYLLTHFMKTKLLGNLAQGQ